MSATPKVLLLDDDQDLLDLYKEILTRLPSNPEVFTCATGARALAMMEADAFTMLICDLNMPKMDGLQVLSIVRRKYPDLRTVVLTSVMDEQFRSRAYALGIDLFWYKPASESEINTFLDCLESLIGQEAQTGGFRGVQSKSLVDIIQLECLSQTSTVLKITNGSLSGKIWINNGDVTDSETGELKGEVAFHKILSWKNGNFEVLAAETDRPRNIFNSYQALLLESAQAQDEASTGASTGKRNESLADILRVQHTEFVLEMKVDGKGIESSGLQNQETIAKLIQQTMDTANALGDRLQAGPLQAVKCFGAQMHIVMQPKGDKVIGVGWHHSTSGEQINESMKQVLTLWPS